MYVNTRITDSECDYMLLCVYANFYDAKCVARSLNAAMLRRGNDVQTPLPNLSDQTPGGRFPGFPLVFKALLAKGFIQRRHLFFERCPGAKPVKPPARRRPRARRRRVITLLPLYAICRRNS